MSEMSDQHPSSPQVQQLVSVSIASASEAAAAPFECAVSRDVSAPAAPVPVDASPFAFAYTGRHDDGVLPAPTPGYYAHVLTAMTEAKALIDAELVRRSAAVAAAAPSGGAAAAAVKRPK